MSDPFLIWDKPEKPNHFAGRVVLVNEHNEEKNYLSLPEYLELNAEKLRSKYLQFISDVGNSKIEGRTISQHLDIGDGLSYWWMTTLAEKSPFKSSNIYQSLLMLALEEMLMEFRPSRVVVSSNKSEYREIMRGICSRLNIPCSEESQGEIKGAISLIKMPIFVLGVASILKRFAIYFRGSFTKKNEWYGKGQNVSIFSYLTHLSASHCNEGIHYSFMWTELPKLLVNNGWSINWIHHFVPTVRKEKLSEGLKLLDSFNVVAQGNEQHEFLDSHLSILVLLKTFRSWFSLRKKVRSLKNIPKLFQVKDSGINLWPLFKDEWASSTSGQTAAINCLWVALFDAVLRNAPRQKLGLYLHENQPWEYALLAAWKKNKHGKIVSVQHATAPFWHLYYFNDSSVYLKQKCNSMPIPDLWSVNGTAAYNSFVSSGYPTDKLITLEALRYLDVDGHKRTKLTSRMGSNVAPNTIKVLALGDLLPGENSLLLALKSCVDVLPQSYQFTFKPHPADTIDHCKRLELDIEQTIEPLNHILENFDVVVCSHATSASLDSYLAGVKPIIFLNYKFFNLNPLRGVAGVAFVCSSNQLIDLLTFGNYCGAKLNIDEDFILSDPKLPRWKKLLLA